MNKDVLIAQNKAAEAERARQSAENKLNQLDMQAGQMVKALEEARQYIERKREYKDNELAALKNQIRYAMGVYRSQKIEPRQITGKGLELFASDPPEDPQTDDWYYDGKYLNWYYLGRWHRERIDE